MTGDNYRGYGVEYGSTTRARCPRRPAKGGAFGAPCMPVK